MTKIEQFVSDQWYDFSCYGEPGRITPREAEADLHELLIDDEASEHVPKDITPSEYAKIWNRLTAHNGFKCDPQPRNKPVAVCRKLGGEIETAILNISNEVSAWSCNPKLNWYDVGSAQHVLTKLHEIENFLGISK